MPRRRPPGRSPSAPRSAGVRTPALYAWAKPNPSRGSDARGFWRELHRHVSRSVDELGPQPLDRACDLDVGQPLEHLFEHDLDLELRQAEPQAEVRTATAEGDVRVE